MMSSSGVRVPSFHPSPKNKSLSEKTIMKNLENEKKEKKKKTRKLRTRKTRKLKTTIEICSRIILIA